MVALNFMHKKSLQYIILKPQNIFMANKDSTAVKLADFGFAAFVDDRLEYDK